MINFAGLKNKFILIYVFDEVATNSLGYLSEDGKECVACIGPDELAVHYGAD